MLNIDLNTDKGTFAANESRAGQLLDITAMLAVLRRQIKLILTVAVTVLALAIGFAVTSTKQYTAQSQILLDLRQASKFGERRPYQQEPTIDNAALDSHVEILRSDAIAEAVIKKLGLVTSSDFTEPTNILGAAVGFLTSLLPSDKATAAPGTVPPSVVDAFQRRLTISRVDQTYVISISYRSDSPVLAAKVANAVAEAYLDEQLRASYDAVKRASAWMRQRIDDLRSETVASDLRLQAFRAENNLLSTGLNGRPLINEQQLADLTGALSAAQAQRAEAKAAYDRISAIVDSKDAAGSVSAALSDPTISELRQKYNDAALKAAETERRYGPNHQVVQRKQAEMQQINDAILNELRRIQASARSTYEIADARLASVQGQLQALQVTSVEADRARVAARELERQVESDRATYQSFLERYKSVTQEESFPISNARILTEASVPEKPSHPKTPVILILGLLGGAALGIGIATLRELFDQETFRTPKQVEEALGVPCLGVLPVVEAPRVPSVPPMEVVRVPSDRAFPERLGIYRYSVREPFAYFTESLRNVMVAADHACGVQPRVVIGVVSSTSGEGKSLVAANLAQLISQYNARVLLIDADIRNPSLTRVIAPKSHAGLAEVVGGRAAFADAVFTDPQTGLHFLPAIGHASSVTNTALLASDVMRQFIDRLEGQYDYVVVDLPPLAPVVDARAMAPLINAFVFVTEWGGTKRHIAVDCLRASPQIHRKTVGVVLNKTDLAVLKSYRCGVHEEYYDRSAGDAGNRTTGALT